MTMTATKTISKLTCTRSRPMKLSILHSVAPEVCTNFRSVLHIESICNKSITNICRVIFCYHEREIFMCQDYGAYEGGPKSNGNWAAAWRENGETHCSTRCLLGRRLLS